MALYSTVVRGVATGTTANTYITLVGLKMANTTGHKAKLRKLRITGGAAAAQDLQFEVRVRRTDNTTDGTSTSWNVNQIGKLDKDSIASIVNAIGHTYTVEPTTYATQILAGGSANTRGVYFDQWAPGEGPEWGINQTLGIEGCMCNGSTAASLSVHIEWEE